MSRFGCAVVAVALAGCGSQYVKLDPAKVRRVEIALVGGGQSMCSPTGIVELQALVVLDDGSIVQTPSRLAPHGKLRPSDLAWTSDTGPIDEQGRLHLPPAHEWFDRKIAIRAVVKGRPAAQELSHHLVVVPRFDCDRQIALDGMPGRTGEPGGPAPQVDVALSYVDTTLNGRLVLARVAVGDRPSYFLLDRKGASGARLVVLARGGAGGHGASGSSGMSGTQGMDGSSGMSGSTCQDGSRGGDGSDGGDGGAGGDGGPGGDGGDGGEVLVSIPPGSPELASAVQIVVAGGPAGRGGDGGRGGSGGAGGRGGRGGSGGSTTNFDGSSCFTHSGSDGSDGRAGSPGPAGRDGPPGQPGRDGSIASRSVAPETLFAGELAAGWQIVK